MCVMTVYAYCLCIRELEASSKNTPLANNDISLVAQVAFITAGCAYTTYANTFQLLGIKPVNNHAFMKTLETLNPIVEAMVNAMCERRTHESRRIWVLETCSNLCRWYLDDTRVPQQECHLLHSKIQDRSTALLHAALHICQKGQDKIIKEDLYRGLPSQTKAMAPGNY